jgi:hypothetical protein
VEGSEVFDAEDGFGVNVDSLDGRDLRCGKSNRWRERIKVDNLSVDIGEFPVSRKMDVGGVGDKVKFVQKIFGGKVFPFMVYATGEADEGGFQVVEAFGVVEDAYAEDAVRCLGCQRG